jgi:REP element-mobilizing transposase RayT
MAHSYACNLLHCVFSTKDRANLITDRERLWQYIAGIARAKKIPLLGIGGTSNHVHALIVLPSVLPLARVIQDLKGNSSKWMTETGYRFAW